MGSTETSDHYRIGLFYFRIKKGSVAHKKVGLRNLVKKFINENWGAFEAAIVVFDSNPEWRLSFICDIKEQATAPKRFTFVFGEHDNNYRTPVERFLELQSKEEPSKISVRLSLLRLLATTFSTATETCMPTSCNTSQASVM